METLGAVYKELIKRLHKAFNSRGLRLSVAESCTAGFISSMLTTVPGALSFFDSAIVPYSVESKKKLLGISNSLIETHGVISEEAARAMAEAMREKTGADFSLAITGNLGPSALEDRKAGLVFVAVAFKSDTTSRGYIFDGNREEVRVFAAVAALEFLYEAVSVYSE